jgi:hypothetical protein
MDSTQTGADDYESTVQLLVELRSLCRAEDLPEHDRLEAIDRALELTVSGSVEEAHDFVQGLLPGTIGDAAH